VSLRFSAWGAILLAAGLLAGSGCATVRRARDAQQGRLHVPGERTLSAAEAGLNSNTVLTEVEAVRLALAAHPTICQATQNLAAAAAEFRRSRSAYWPSVNGSASYGRSTSNTEGMPDYGESRDGYSADLSLDLTLWDFGRTPAALRQARARLDAAAEALRAARSDVALAVRGAFYDLCKALELGQVAEEAAHQFRVHLDQVRAFAEVGRRTRYDVTKAEVDLGNAELDRINARSAVSNARAALTRALGLAEDPGYGVEAGAVAEFPADAEALAAAARTRHPDLRRLRALEHAASAAVDAAIADLYPDLTLGAQFGGSGESFPLAWNWSAALRSALRFFTGWQRTWRVEQAVAELRAARAQAAAQEQQIRLDLRQALNQLESARRRLDVTALVARQARESLELVSERYRVGAASAVEVTDAEVALSRAKADGVEARFDFQTAVARIRHATGEAW
jgi:outer membrane protein